eukprot:gene11141-23283_t
MDETPTPHDESLPKSGGHELLQSAKIIYGIRWYIFTFGMLSMCGCAYVGFTGLSKLDNGGLVDPRSESVMTAAHLSDRLVYPDYMIVLMLTRPVGTTWTVDHPSFKAACNKVKAGLQSLKVSSIISFVDHPEQIKLVSTDRTKMLMVGTTLKSTIKNNDKLISAVSGSELDVKVSGLIAAGNEVDDELLAGLEKAEIITLPFVILLLFWTTGGVVAGLAPWIVCLASITWSLAIMQGIHYSFRVASTTLNVITMFGLGL